MQITAEAVTSSRKACQDQPVSVDLARLRFLGAFRWENDDADVWPVFTDADVLAAVIDGLVEPWRGCGVTKVVGIESRGFLLGGAAAVDLGVGFAAIRKRDGLFPGPKVTVRAAADYRGLTHELRLQQRALRPEDRVLLVDDWAERGSQATAARHLVQAVGASFLGVALLVDQLSDATRSGLARVTSLVTADDLGSADELR